MSIEKITTSDLLRLLQYQYPSGISTFAPCPSCGGGSRGGRHCANCICSELTRRGVNSRLVDSLRLLLEQRLDMSRQIEAAIAAIQKEGG